MTPLEQRMSALQVANRVRIHKSTQKRLLGEGRARLTDVLEDPDMGSERAVMVLLALPWIGEHKADTILRKAGVSTTVRLRDLTDRQKNALWLAVYEVSEKARMAL